MKEAAGEANMTVLVIVLIAIVAAVATPLISKMMDNLRLKSCCTEAGGTWTNNSCQAPSGTFSSYDVATYNDCASETAE